MDCFEIFGEIVVHFATLTKSYLKKLTKTAYFLVKVLINQNSAEGKASRKRKVKKMQGRKSASGSIFLNQNSWKNIKNIHLWDIMKSYEKVKNVPYYII